MKGVLIKIYSFFLDKIWKHALRRYVFFYILIVLVSAVINWAMFSRNSTSYAISSQVNKYVERYDLLDSTINLASFHKGVKDEMPVAIDDYVMLIRPEFNRLDSINVLLERYQGLSEKNQSRLENLYKMADKEREVAIQAFTDSMLYDNQQQIDILKRYMLGKDSTDLILQGKFVELANLKAEYAKKNVKVLEYVIKHFGSFIPDSISNELDRLNNTGMSLANKIQNLENRRRDVSSTIKSSVNKFHWNRRESVNFLDFVYYSICVSTTVSFGDIAPNNGWTRLVAILELLACLILVGVIIDKISKKVNRGE